MSSPAGLFFAAVLQLFFVRILVFQLMEGVMANPSPLALRSPISAILAIVLLVPCFALVSPTGSSVANCLCVKVIIKVILCVVFFVLAVSFICCIALALKLGVLRPVSRN